MVEFFQMLLLKPASLACGLIRSTFCIPNMVITCSIFYRWRDSILLFHSFYYVVEENGKCIKRA